MTVYYFEDYKDMDLVYINNPMLPQTAIRNGYTDDITTPGYGQQLEILGGKPMKDLRSTTKKSKRKRKVGEDGS